MSSRCFVSVSSCSVHNSALQRGLSFQSSIETISTRIGQRSRSNCRHFETAPRQWSSSRPVFEVRAAAEAPPSKKPAGKTIDLPIWTLRVANSGDLSKLEALTSLPKENLKEFLDDQSIIYVAETPDKDLAAALIGTSTARNLGPPADEAAAEMPELTDAGEIVDIKLADRYPQELTTTLILAACKFFKQSGFIDCFAASVEQDMPLYTYLSAVGFVKDPDVSSILHVNLLTMNPDPKKRILS